MSAAFATTFPEVPVDVRPAVSVVLAEELTLVREGLAAICQAGDRFCVVGKCADGSAALKMIEELQPQVALLDMNLPKMFTLEVLRQVKSAGLKTKLVVMSTRSDRKTVLEALRSGAAAFLLKNGPAQHLLDAFDQVLTGSIYMSPLLQMDKIFVAHERSEPTDPMDRLSPREYQVFALLIEGVRAKEIAARLGLSPKTIDTYRASLMQKLDIHDVAGLVKFSIHREMVAV